MQLSSAPLVAAMILGIGLAGCNQPNRGGGMTVSSAAGPCTPFKGVDAAASPPAASSGSGGSSAVEECLHRWGYQLAQSKEAADVAAAATVTACAAPISAWNQQALGQAGQAPEQATSLTTGQPVDPLTEHAQFAQSQALFYVVQARAGKCAPPPDRLLAR